VWLVGLGIALVLVVAGATALIPALPERVLNPGSGILRLGIWDAALHMGLDHPILGIGPDQFLNQFQLKDAEGNYIYMPKELEQEAFTSHPHNLFLDFWLSLGIMGLFVLIWLLWRYYREALTLARWSASRSAGDPVARALAIGLIAAMTDFLVHGLVDNSYFLMDLALIFWMCCAVVQLLRAGRNNGNIEHEQPVVD
jgi:O-antigen ligase